MQKAATNLGWLVAERAVRFLLVVVVGFYVARHLGPERLGLLSYVLAIVTLVGAVAALGLDPIVRRSVLQSPQRTGEILAAARGLRLAAGMIGYLVVAGLAFTVPKAEGERLMYFILGILVFQPALLVPDIWMQANLNAKHSAWAQTAALVVAAAWRIALVLGGAPLVAFAWAAVGEVLLAAIAIRFFASRLGFPRFRELVPHEAIRELLRECWPLALAGLAVAIYMKIDEVMLRFLIGAEAVGIYTAATRLTEVWYFLPAAIASSVLPALLRARDRGPQAYEARLQQYYDLNAAVAYAVAIPLALLSGWVVQIAYGPEFAGSAPIVSIHVWSLVFVFLGTARGQWLVNEKLQMFYLKATVSGAVVNIGLNFLLIPRWQGVGAAVATLVAQAVSSWVSSYASASTRGAARMQTRALFVPFLGARHLRATS